MNTIKVNTSKSYDVLVGNGLLKELGSRLRSVTKADKIAIVSDSNVWSIYGETVYASLEGSHYQSIITFVVSAGEQSKNATTFLDLLEFLANNQITRTDCVIALGGGVVGDLTGFAAACFLRGVDYVQVPTSLLACVDSSVGGKTAIDLKAGKNLAGAFYQPRLVLCDTAVLDTLPEDVFRDGCAEVIKYGILYDQNLFAHLMKNGLNFDREWVITQCIRLKRDVVAQDEFDRGERQKLNLGHTIGHGLEVNSDFAISHGKAVAIGMAFVARAGAKYGICTDLVRDEIMTIIHQFGLPTQSPYSAEAIYASALSDKKRNGGSVNLIVPKAIGECTIRPTPIDELKEFIKAGF